MNAIIILQKKWFRLLPFISILITQFLMFTLSEPLFFTLTGLLSVLGMSICIIAMKRALYPGKYFKEISIERYVKIILYISFGMIFTVSSIWLLVIMMKSN